MIKLRFIAVLVTAILFSTLSMGASYYVDSYSGKDSNPGNSELSPWKSIAKVNSKNLKPGDVVLFKRGGVWKETLYISQSGTSSLPITFGSYGSGNLPLIDGGLSRAYGIYLSGRSYIIIREFKIQNTKHGAVYITDGKYITVRESEMYVTGRAGVFIQRSSLSLISNNKMWTPDTYYNVQTDGIYAQRNINNSYDRNYIVISNQHADQHCDAIQFFQETNATVKNNYVEQDNTKGGNAQGIYCSENSGIFKIFNNVGYGMHTTSSLIKFMNTGTSGKSEIIGNTLYGGKGALVQTNDPNIIFKNNIVMTAGQYPSVSFQQAVNNKSNINFNLYKRDGSSTSLIEYAGSNYTIDEWSAEGFDKNGMEADPKFVNISKKNFKLASGSPAMDKGVNLSPPYNVDQNGMIRPRGLKADIGAFETLVLTDVENGGSVIQSTTETLPGSFELAQNYPNPFNPSTTIKYSLPENADVSIKVYDITGSQVAELVNNMQNAGTHEITFDASSLASGTYIYTIKAGSFAETKKMVLLK